MSLARQILKNAGALTAARGVSAVCTFITTVYLARVLEPAGYGILSWGLAFLAYFSFAAGLGMGVYGTREVARSEAQAHRLPGHVLFLRLTSSLLTLGVFLGVVLLLDEDPLFKLTVGVLGLSLLAHALELGWVYHGLQRLGVVAVRNVVASVVTLAGVFVFVREPDQIVLAAGVMVAAIALPNVWLLVTYVREFGLPRFAVDRRLWWGMLVPALPIAASHLLTTINTNLDQVMLGLLRTETEVGWYAAAYRVLMAATIPWQIVHQAFLPSLSSAVGDREIMRARARPFATTLYALGFPIAAGGALLASDIVTIFGSGYAPAGVPLVILMVSMAPMYIRIVFGVSLVAWDRQRAYTAVLAVGAALNVGLNIALIPRYGMTGAAVATLATEGVVAAGTAVLYHGSVGELHLGAFGRAVLATAVGVVLPLLGARALGVPPFGAAVVAVVAYAVAALMLRIVDPTLLQKLRRQPS